MTKTPRREPGPATEIQLENLNALVAGQVLRTLGEPAGLLKVQVRLLWENYYRVNILVGVDAGSARIPHSYFVETDGLGNVIESTPKITRQY